MPHEPGKSSLQPKLWLIGTAVAVGIGVGLVAARAPGDPYNPLSKSPALFGVFGLVQALVGWALVRAGEKPEESLLADLLREQLQRMNAVAEPKPLLWSLAFLLFWLAAMSLTLFVVLVIQAT